ncbi:MAG: cytochrome c [Burkholderiales bacterium]|nr:cytochrome c [Burkholderiales bacterium]
MQTAIAQVAVLEVNNGAATLQWTRAALLTQTTEIRIEQDVTYRRAMTYRAIALNKLLPHAEQYGTVQFVAADGFVANIAGKDLAGAGQAYLAIETPEQAWPAIDTDHPQKKLSAGPYYLVWGNPKAGKIGSEQWPYQVVKINVVRALSERFPQIRPAALPRASYPAALRGMAMYTKHCSVCHQMNGGGDAAIGPDLNLPYSPSDYFQEAFLKKLIRQPQSVRSWKNAQMPGFDRAALSDQELGDLIIYLRHMAKQQ